MGSGDGCGNGDTMVSTKFDTSGFFSGSGLTTDSIRVGGVDRSKLAGNVGSGGQSALLACTGVVRGLEVDVQGTGRSKGCIRVLFLHGLVVRMTTEG